MPGSAAAVARRPVEIGGSVPCAEELVLERADAAAGHRGELGNGVEFRDEVLALAAECPAGIEVDAVVEIVVR